MRKSSIDILSLFYTRYSELIQQNIQKTEELEKARKLKSLSLRDVESLFFETLLKNGRQSTSSDTHTYNAAVEKVNKKLKSFAAKTAKGEICQPKFVSFKEGKEENVVAEVECCCCKTAINIAFRTSKHPDTKGNKKKTNNRERFYITSPQKIQLQTLNKLTEHFKKCDTKCPLHPLGDRMKAYNSVEKELASLKLSSPKYKYLSLSSADDLLSVTFRCSLCCDGFGVSLEDGADEAKEWMKAHISTSHVRVLLCICIYFFAPTTVSSTYVFSFIYLTLLFSLHLPAHGHSEDPWSRTGLEESKARSSFRYCELCSQALPLQ